VNSTLQLLEARFSTRVYAPTPITDAEKAAILHATMRAPTGGNMMLYSIIEVTDQALKERLAVTCDDQPFIAKAPWVLVFVADFQKWVDLFRFARVEEMKGVEHRLTPGPGDLMLACSDALIAAQNAVVAAESLGIGSCYIGDILEQAEVHADLLGLPQHTLPIAMLCFGRASKPRPPVPRYEKHVVHENRYHRLTPDELAEVTRELGEMHSPHGYAPGIDNEAQAVYTRKYASDFMAEMNRSVAWWLERWSSAEETR
jgi:FMN reductase (NADPH)/FMN reductase [NAD(P)H]